MEKWKVKGIVKDEPKSKQQTEQAVLDKAVEKGEIEPEAAGKKDNDVIKVNLDKLKNQEKDAVQKQSTNEVSVRDGSETSKEVQKENEEKVKEPTGENKQKEENKGNEEEQGKEVDSPLELVKEEDNKQPEKTNQPKIDERAAEVNKKPEPAEDKLNLPENVEKLVKFMDETGGSIEDYVDLNKDVSKYSDAELLRQYYTKSKPWDQTEITEFMEDNFSYSEEEDDPKDIRAKKRAYKEELFKAKSFFDNNKNKYYANIKLNKEQSIPEDYKKALTFYNESQKTNELTKQLTQTFLEKTDNVFSDSFKGFDFQVGDNKYRYKVNNVAETKKYQSDLNNFLNTFLDKNTGEMINASGYHKAIFAAKNADKIAQHFYEQGRADALQQSAKEAKNINMEPRKEGFIETKSGQKFRVVSGNSSSKLRVKLKQ